MIPKFLYPLLAYRSLFAPFLIACAIAVPCWFAVRWYRRRTMGIKAPLSREILLLAFVVYCSGLVVATLLPNHNSRRAAEAALGVDLRPNLASLTCRAPALREGSWGRSFCVRNARGNLLLFLPLGFLLPLVWPRLRLRTVIPVAVAISVSIEVIQYLSRAWSNRSTDVNDIILNTAGASLGLLLAATLRRFR